MITLELIILDCKLTSVRRKVNPTRRKPVKDDLNSTNKSEVTLPNKSIVELSLIRYLRMKEGKLGQQSKNHEKIQQTDKWTDIETNMVNQR